MNSLRLLPALCMYFILSFGCNPPAPEPKAPNFLFLFADDQAFNTIHALGNDLIHTPNLDRLVAEGFTFTHCFNQGSWSGAVCVVSRGMLNSGRYIYRVREDINNPDIPLWGETLGAAGYTTFLTGKWHNGNQTALRGFQQAKSIGKGMFETKGGRKGMGYYRPAPDRTEWAPDDRSLLGHWSPNVKDIVYDGNDKKIGEEYTVEQHTSELYADNAVEFLQQRKQGNKDKPFFMYVAFNAPHDPRQAPTEYVEKYPKEKIPLPENYMEEHPFDQGERHTLRDEVLAAFPRTPDVTQTHLQEYYAITSHMDHEIGRILAALEASGEAENTYIFFTADHGLAVGSHGLMGKQNQYDHSIRVPMMVVGPDIPQGKQSDALVYLQNLYATSCDLAGISTPSTVEFASVLPIIKGEAEKGETAIFGSYKDFQRMVRDEQFKLIVYPEAGEIQLFDLEQDPAEMHNLAQEQPEKVQTMFEKLLELQGTVGDTLDLSGMGIKG